ncbi:hypothetical protein FJZ53_03460 [Candidatus Woesearchaeota archaeon]|nr:hypothetical protein [Candidatus Woesearchaeota archaeon]
MNEILAAGLIGGLGGLTRGTVGLIKAVSLKRRVLWNYWVLTAITAIIIGMFTGAVLSSNPKVSLLAGYAGTDILDGVYKSFRAKKAYGKYEKPKKK